MAGYFDLFPFVGYDINRNLYSTFNLVTDVTFRVGILRSILVNSSAYYEYEVQDGETPEILAERFYGDPNAHWILLYANDIYDPQYDWPMNYDVFNKYIANKYGSFEYAASHDHRYEKVIEQRDSATGEVSVQRYVIAKENLLVNTNIDIPNDCFYDELPETGEWETLTVGRRTFEQRTYRNAVTLLDHEIELNNIRRRIKVIKTEYYPKILQEFRDLSGYEDPMIRKLR